VLVRSSDDRLGFERVELIYLALLAFVVIADLWFEFDAPTWGTQPPHAHLLDKWLLCALLGTAFAHFLKAVQFSERIILIALSAIFLVVGQVAIAFSGRLALVAYAVTAASAVTYLYMLVAGRRSFSETVKIVAPVWLIVLSVPISGSFINFTGTFTSQTYDRYLFLFEEQLGVRIAVVFQILVTKGPQWLTPFLQIVYGSVPAMVALHFGFDKTKHWPMPLVVVLSSIAGAALYLVYPAVGPEFTVENYYNIMFPTTHVDFLDLSKAQAVRNCMPSLHAAWGYFFLWNSSTFSRAVRYVFWLFGVLTLVAAVVIGRHWFIDLIVALPFATAIQGLFASHLRWSNPKRFLTIFCSVLILSFWLVMLQTDWFVSGLPSALCWALIASTVFVSVKLAYEIDDLQESANVSLQLKLTD